MAQDAIQVWMSNARGAEYGFLKAVAYALEQFQHKNNLPLTALVAICNGKPFSNYKIIKGDRLQYAAPLKRIMDKALSEAKLTFKDGSAKWKVASQGGVNADVLATVQKLAEQQVRVQSAMFKEHFPVVKKDDTRDDAAKIAAFKVRAAKFAEEHGLSLSVLAHALTAKDAEPAH